MTVCRRCDFEWHGLSQAHCAVCHLTFGSVGGFDTHRVGLGGDRRCRTTTELRHIGMEPNERDVWRVPRDPDTLPGAADPSDSGTLMLLPVGPTRGRATNGASRVSAHPTPRPGASQDRTGGRS